MILYQYFLSKWWTSKKISTPRKMMMNWRTLSFFFICKSREKTREIEYPPTRSSYSSNSIFTKFNSLNWNLMKGTQKTDDKKRKKCQTKAKILYQNIYRILQFRGIEWKFNLPNYPVRSSLICVRIHSLGKFQRIFWNFIFWRIDFRLCCFSTASLIFFSIFR